MSDLLQGLNQSAAVSLFNLRTIPQRLGSAVTAVIGIAGVVAVLVSVLAISEGFRKAMTSTGADDVAVVLRSGADSELTSGFSRDETRFIRDAATQNGAVRDASGAMVSAELFVIVDLPKRTTNSSANVPMRGVEPAAFDLRGGVKIVQGRRFQLGRNEVIVGAGAAREFAGLNLGQLLRIGQNSWEVVGIFEASGGPAESEIWTDAAVLLPAYQRDGYQSVYVKLTSPEVFSKFKDALTSDPKLTTKVKTLKDFYADQADQVTDFITNIGVAIAVLMGMGALFSALNTMYSSVAARTREIATLRALGFGAGAVVLSVLVESLVLAIVGGLVGALLSYVVFDGFTTSTMNFQSFTQLSFAFAVTPNLLAQAILWAAVLGLLGGLFPAIRAARIPIASGLREP